MNNCTISEGIDIENVTEKKSKDFFRKTALEIAVGTADWIAIEVSTEFLNKFEGIPMRVVRGATEEIFEKKINVLAEEILFGNSGRIDKGIFEQPLKEYADGIWEGILKIITERVFKDNG